MSRRCRACDVQFRPDAAWQKCCWPCWRELQAQAREPRTVVVTPVDGELIRTAVALCHPSRHPADQADVCRRVTTALLDALERLDDVEPEPTRSTP